MVIPKAVYSYPKTNYSVQHSTIGIQLTPGSTTAGGEFTGGSLQKSFVQHELLNWTSFVKQKLYLENYGTDRVDKRPGRICQKGYSHISPCQRNTTYVPNGIRQIPSAFLRHLFASANDPVYELDEQGAPYDHLLHLRSSKIQNFLHIPTFWDVSALAVILYEQLCNDTEGILAQIGNTINQTVQCTITPSSKKAQYNLPSDFQQWISNHADWRIEQLIGYHRRKSKHY
jgi:hypothetical protein